VLYLPVDTHPQQHLKTPTHTPKPVRKVNPKPKPQNPNPGKGENTGGVIQKVISELNRCTEKCKDYVEVVAEYEDCVRSCMWPGGEP